ncbi:MAG: hypothetical protein JCHSAcid_07390 [uncultured Acidilobus sp. JCHS]|nr:MAG: hypothetical protein JCHSAcid_07390 [uncultured Acidilobus sp. JCHS]
MYTTYTRKGGLLKGALLAIGIAVAVLVITIFMVKPFNTLGVKRAQQSVTNVTVSLNPMASYIANFTVPPNYTAPKLVVQLTSSGPVALYVLSTSDLGMLEKTGGAPTLLYYPNATNVKASASLPGPGEYSIVIINRAPLASVNVRLEANITETTSS